MRDLSHFRSINAHWRLVTATFIFYICLFSAVKAGVDQPPAPNVSFRTLTGETLQLDKLQGKPVLLSFWSTSCAICIHEMPQMKKLYHTLEARGAAMVSATMPYDPPNHVVEITAEFDLPFPVAIDLDGALMKAFDIQGTPVKILLSPEGNITHTFLGALDLEKTLRAVDSLLASTTAPRRSH